jgi:hypothetical protein
MLDVANDVYYNVQNLNTNYVYCRLHKNNRSVIRCFSFSKMHVFRHVSLCRFTNFGPYLVDTEISKTL